MTMQKKRTANFRDDETRILIQLWGSPTIQTQMNTCHRKAPIMSQLSAMMQQYGFFRSPEEITTRIRNLKCIYHKIKKSLHMQTGLGVIDPDWHYFKAIDAILGDGSLPPRLEASNFVGKVKQESLYSNDSHSSLYDNDGELANHCSPMQALTITSSTTIATGSSASFKTSPPGSSNRHMEDEVSSLGHRKYHHMQEMRNRIGHPDTSRLESRNDEYRFGSPQPKKKRLESQEDTGVPALLQQLLDVEREHLEIERQRLELDRLVGSQLMALVPVVSTILQGQAISHTEQAAAHQRAAEASREKRRASRETVSDEMECSILRSFASEFRSMQDGRAEPDKGPVSSSLSARKDNNTAPSRMEVNEQQDEPIPVDESDESDNSNEGSDLFTSLDKAEDHYP